MKKRILVIDDDKKILLLLERLLSRRGLNVTTCTDGQEAIQLFRNEKYHLILCDLALEKIDGLQLLEIAKQYAPQVPFVILSGHYSIPLAEEALDKGAFSYLVKPCDNEKIFEVVRKALNEKNLEVPSEKSKDPAFKGIIGQSPKMQRVFNLVKQIGPTSATVLIQGESGTGKELIARAVHQASNRKSSAFIAVNCGTLSDNLLENELFGHVQGAFTGATRLKKGLLVEADKGTLFLDEVSETPLTVQTKFLRVLQEKEFKPLGSNEISHVDVRVITATNLNLQQAIKDKIFREDLYYRLAVIPIYLPPLRERKEDIQDLAMYFVNRYGEENNKDIRQITPEAIAKLQAYHWPGNVRELENTMARAVALSSGSMITPDLLWGMQDNLFDEVPEKAVEFSSIESKQEGDLKGMLGYHTQKAIEDALEATKGNRSKAARLLGISRTTLYHKIKEFSLEK